ncbi:MAG: type II toxin-antitoxin system HicB family antitoxin [Chloroflexota bacterium]|nr:MAG: type II toxin-antitoxin system HicB family antitoxin [Chloroflexota bacterium]
MRQYSIILHPDVEQGGYWVTVPSLPGCVSQGDSLEEAVSNAREAIALHIAGLIADGEPVPEEAVHPQTVVIDVAAERWQRQPAGSGTRSGSLSARA